jgi:hypothetical protein
MKINLPTNLQEVEKKSFEPIPPGTYELEIKAVEEKQGTKAPYLNVTLEVINDEDYAGRKIFEMVSLSPDALWKLKELADAIGQDISESFDTEDLLGEMCTGVVTIERGQAKDKNDPDSERYPDKNRVKEFK